VPIYLLQIYSKVIPSKNIDTLLFLTGIALIAILFLGLLEALRRSLLVKAGTRFEYLLSQHLLNSAIHRSIKKSYASVNVLRELSRVRNFISGTELLPLLDAPWTPLFILMLFALHPYIGAIGVIGAIIMICLAVINEKTSRKLMEDANDASKSHLDIARAYVNNAHAVQAMGMQKHILPQWSISNAKTLSKNAAATGLHTRISSISKSIRLCLQIVIICVAAWLIVTNELTAGATIASVLLLRRAIAPIEGSIRSWKSLVASRQAFFNISEYLNHATTFDAPKPMPTPKGELIGTNLGFRPTGHKKALFSRANISIKPGTVTALVGSTAAGKSTLLKLLCGILTPSSGTVSLGGYDLSQWDSESLGQHIGYLPQDVALFPGTVRENIARFSDAPIDAVIKASKLAYSHELIQKLPQGYETVIEEDGRNLSGGQKQRIGLARALFGNPVVVLLDEPDANLDSRGRRSLRKSFNKIKLKNIAVVVITHQRSIEKAADIIYQLSNTGLKQIENPNREAASKKTASNRNATPAGDMDDTGLDDTLTELNAAMNPPASTSDKTLSLVSNTTKQQEPTPGLTPEQRVQKALQTLAIIRSKAGQHS